MLFHILWFQVGAHDTGVTFVLFPDAVTCLITCQSIGPPPDERTRARPRVVISAEPRVEKPNVGLKAKVESEPLAVTVWISKFKSV